MRHLALDGPFNGDYLSSADAAANDYELAVWPEGEEVYLHVPTEAIATNEDGVPLEIAREIEEPDDGL